MWRRVVLSVGPVFVLQYLSNAQVVITQGDLPHIGSSYTVNVDIDPLAGIAITPPGPDMQHWDFADLLSAERNNSFVLVAPGAVQGFQDHPGATHAILRTRDVGGITATKGQFFRADSDGLFYIGHTTTFDTIAETEGEYDDWLVVPAPFSFGSALHVDGHIVEVKVHHPGLMLPAEMKVRRRSRDYLSDAWGTLSTPAYPMGMEVIRVKEFNAVSIDSLYLDYSTTGNGPWFLVDVDTTEHNTRYAFYKRTDPSLVMSLGMQRNDSVVTRVKYVAVGPDPIISVDDPDGGLFLFPNPCSSGDLLVTLAEGKAERVILRGADGRMVDDISMEADAQFKYRLPLLLANGCYSLTCFSAKGNELATGKFVVAR
ncbi:MAG: hypothetical protein ABI599_15415 [Flavobacteriales bacterium]